MEITPATSSTSQSASSVAGTSLADTFDTFLTLLTTQLENQDPLDPLDSNEFTQQLVQFTQAEQLIATNTNLEKLISLTQGNAATDALGYLGTTIASSGNTTALSNGVAAWLYELPVNASQTSIKIKDQTGAVVATGVGETTKGEHSIVWDGRDDQGVPQPDGLYEIEVEATDANGASIAVITSIQGIVEGVEVTDTATLLSIGDMKVPLDDVTSVKLTPLTTAPPADESEAQSDEQGSQEQPEQQDQETETS